MSAKEAGYAVSLGTHTLLDVRPTPEHDKARVKNSVWLPAFDVNRSLDPGTALNKLSSFLMGIQPPPSSYLWEAACRPRLADGRLAPIPRCPLSLQCERGTGRWWSGAPVTKPNERFMPDLVQRIPKSTSVIVACQKGLRSLAVCEQMYKAGYRNLYWLNGGFDATEEGVSGFRLPR
eukprot:SM002499S08264  [mRNA]  locus=s2499:699:1667:+ [translate_table: standard]